MNVKLNQIKVQKLSDILAISLHGLCIVHCLVAPATLVLFPILGSTFFSDDLFHRLMFFLILPTGAIALLLGCKLHKDRYTIVLGILGFLILILNTFWGHEIFGTKGEKIVTVIAGLTMSLGHFRNYRLCQRVNCHNH